MTRSKSEKTPEHRLRALALSYPETTVGTACRRSSFKARNKSFLFMGSTDDGYDLMVKLGDSRPEAEQLAQAEPEHYKVGSQGWVTASFEQGQRPPRGLFERWIDESYRMLAPRGLVNQLSELAGGPKPSSTKRSRVRSSTNTGANKPSSQTPAKKKTTARKVAKKKSRSAQFTTRAGR